MKRFLYRFIETEWPNPYWTMTPALDVVPVSSDAQSMSLACNNRQRQQVIKQIIKQIIIFN